jgi:hypothetical protein
MERAGRVLRILVRGGHPETHADLVGEGSTAPPDGYPTLTAVLEARFGPGWVRQNCDEIRRLAQAEAMGCAGVGYAEPAGGGGPAGGEGAAGGTDGGHGGGRA